ncbi:hypothetical protein RDV78_05915 [Bacillota bacterium LX-D]|nr:hypothetical protein [Bacillota bacterium LX-D]
MDRFNQKKKQQEIRIIRYAGDILVFAKTHREARKYQDIAAKILKTNSN